MEKIASYILYLHLGAGSISLILFWLPLFTAKGSQAHRQMGRIYVLAMWVVVISALLLSFKNLLIGDYIRAGFLGFLAILTTTPLWYAKAIIRNKRGITGRYYHQFKVLHGMTFWFGLGLVVWSISLKLQGAAILMLIFGILGLSNFREAFGSFRYLKKKESWIVTHLEGMISTGIAAYTAFFAFGARQFFSSILTEKLIVIPWILPSIIGALGIRYYRRRFSKKKAIQAI